MRYFVFSQCLKITEKSLIQHYFCKPEAYGHTVLSDILIGEKVVGNAKTQKCDIFVIFKHCVPLTKRNCHHPIAWKENIVCCMP